MGQKISDDYNEFYNLNKDEIYKAISDIIPDVENIESEELKLKNYSHYLGYWFHPILKVSYSRIGKLYYKFAILELMDPNNIDKKFSKLIYLKDKYANNRKVSETSVDRSDTFIPYLEKGKCLRFQGTKVGSGKYNVAQGEKYRENNKEFLRVLHNGPKSAKLPIKCHYNNSILEGIEVYSYTRGETIILDEFEVHHCLLKNNNSYYYNIDKKCIDKKSKDPSEYLNSLSYNNFTNNIVSEFMGSILLSVSKHSTLHKTETSDGIDRWLDRYNKGICESIPYAWKSENNYIEVLNWISINCSKVDITRFLNYNQFIDMHSMNILSSIE